MKYRKIQIFFFLHQAHLHDTTTCVMYMCLICTTELMDVITEAVVLANIDAVLRMPAMSVGHPEISCNGVVLALQCHYKQPKQFGNCIPFKVYPKIGLKLKSISIYEKISSGTKEPFFKQ